MRTSIMIVAALAAGNVAWAEEDLGQVVRAQVKAQAGGAPQVGELYEGSGEKTDFQVLLEADKCYWFSGAAAGKIEKLAMYLWKPNSNLFTPRLTDVKSTSGKAVMAHCTKEAGMYRLQAKIEGEGRYVVAVFGKDAPKQAAPAPVEVKEKAEPNLGPLCDRSAKAAAHGAKRLGDFFGGEGNSIGHDDRYDWTVMMEAGKCYWIIGCGEPDHIKSLSLYLWGPDNKRITEAKSDNPSPMLGHCAALNGMYKFQAKITGGGGHFKVGVYVK